MSGNINEKEKKYIERVASNYKEKEVTKLDELKRLNSKASKGANMFAYIFGSIGALVLGTGMSIAMGVILQGQMLIGILIGLVGILMVSVNYFIYVKLLEKGRKKYSNEIISLSDELLNK